MDNAVTARYLTETYRPELRRIFLCHLSHDNNTPETAMATMINSLRSVSVVPATSPVDIHPGSVYIAPTSPFQVVRAICAVMKLFDLITGLIAPRLCEACGRTLVPGRKALCMHCKASLPLSMANRADLRAAKLPRTAPVADVYPWLAYSHANPVCSLIREGQVQRPSRAYQGPSQSYSRMIWPPAARCRT